MRRSSVIIAIGFTVTLVAGSAEAKLDLYIDKSSQQMSVVQNGYLLRVWPVSTGRDRFATPSGVYTPERLERSWFSKAYYNSPMPHAIFFHNGYAIHGSYDITRLGGPASHGCIRLHPQNAAMLFAMVEQEGPSNTTIVVGGDTSPSLQLPRYRESDEFRSAYLGDGRIARSAYPPGSRVTPYSSTPQYYGGDSFADGLGPRSGGYDQFAMRSSDPGMRPPAPPRDAEAPPEPTFGARDNYRLPPRGAYPAMRPPVPPRDAEAPLEPTFGPRDNYRLPPRGASPVMRPPAPPRDAEAPLELTVGPRDGGRLPIRGSYSLMRPPAPPRDAEVPLEPTVGPRDGYRPPIRSAYPVMRPVPPRRDAGASIEPKTDRRDGNGLPTKGTYPAIKLPASVLRNVEASIQPKIGPRGDHLLAVNKSNSKCPACSLKPGSDEAANQRANPSETAKSPPAPVSASAPAQSSPPPAPSPAGPTSSAAPAPSSAAPAPSPSEQEQPTRAYKVLPKSYWAGASWRWRLKSDQDTH